MKARMHGEQGRLWNGVAGRAWVDARATLDRMFLPVQELLIQSVVARGGQRVLDIGCGTGGTTLAFAARLQGTGRCVGLDLSEPMIALARDRARNAAAAAEFIAADAQTHAFAPAAFDLLLSRFGVMFFEDPVAAFANLHRAASANAELRFVAWRTAAENPFMTTGERAAAPLLADLPTRRPGAPGQFAFAERQHVTGILQASGWQDIDIRPIDIECSFAEADLLTYLSRLGPVGLILPAQQEDLRKQVIARMREAFESYVRGAQVHFTAACWRVSARR